jgi:hypothetical protein
LFPKEAKEEDAEEAKKAEKAPKKGGIFGFGLFKKK